MRKFSTRELTLAAMVAADPEVQALFRAGREAVLEALSCREMEALLRELLEGTPKGGGNPNFDWRRYQALRGGKA